MVKWYLFYDLVKYMESGEVEMFLLDWVCDEIGF